MYCLDITLNYPFISFIYQPLSITESNGNYFCFFFIFSINETSTADIRYDLEVVLTTHHAKLLGTQIKLFDNINELNTAGLHNLAGTKYSKYTCNH